MKSLESEQSLFLKGRNENYFCFLVQKFIIKDEICHFVVNEKRKNENIVSWSNKDSKNFLVCFFFRLDKPKYKYDKNLLQRFESNTPQS